MALNKKKRNTCFNLDECFINATLMHRKSIPEPFILAATGEREYGFQKEKSERGRERGRRGDMRVRLKDESKGSKERDKHGAFLTSHFS
jgi:hypothetical protein